MRHIIRFHVSKGENYYVAQGLDLPIVTQGRTLDELAQNINEAVSTHLEGENLAELGLAPNLSVLADLELTPLNV